MIWQLNLLFVFNVFVVIFVSNSSVDSHYHHFHQQRHENSDHVANITTMRSMNDVNDGKDEKLMTYSNQPKSEQNKPNADDNNSLNDIMKRRHDVIMNARRIGYQTLMNTIIYTLTLIPLLFTFARTFNTWPNGK